MHHARGRILAEVANLFSIAVIEYGSTKCFRVASVASSLYIILVSSSPAGSTRWFIGIATHVRGHFPAFTTIQRFNQPRKTDVVRQTN